MGSRARTAIGKKSNTQIENIFHELIFSRFFSNRILCRNLEGACASFSPTLYRQTRYPQINIMSYKGWKLPFEALSAFFIIGAIGYTFRFGVKQMQKYENGGRPKRWNVDRFDRRMMERDSRLTGDVNKPLYESIESLIISVGVRQRLPKSSRIIARMSWRSRSTMLLTSGWVTYIHSLVANITSSSLISSFSLSLNY
jgi:hypothetical protein